MKNVSKRTKIILALGGVLIVVSIVVGVVMTQTPVGGLFGAAVDLVITPSNPTIIVGQTQTLTVNAKQDCSWASSDMAIVSIIDYCYPQIDGTIYCPERKSITIKGNVNGSAIIMARCGWTVFNVNRATATVTVYTPPLVITPSQPRVSLNGWVELSVPSVYNCTWSSSNSSAVAVATKSGSSAIAEGKTAGQSATITAECGTAGSTSAVVTITQ